MDLAQFFSVRHEAGEDHHASFEELTQRWHRNLKVRDAVLHSIRAQESLPQHLAMLTFKTLHGEVKLVDLRGIDLSGERIGAVDLSYCCFDFARFDGARFEETHFQFSSFAFASFEKTSWIGVQASPVSAPRAKFIQAMIAKTFLMRSDLEGADLSNCNLTSTRLTGANLQGVLLPPPSETRAVEVSGALFTSTAETRAWLESGGVSGKPNMRPQTASPDVTWEDLVVEDQAASPHFSPDLLLDLNLIDHNLKSAQREADTWKTLVEASKNKRHRVLVVDDSPTVLEASSRILAAVGLEVLRAESGTQAIEMAKYYRPNLVLMDIEMPGMSGIETVHRLRGAPWAALLPVIMMSAQTGKYDYQVLNSGAQGFVAKPFQGDELIQKLTKWLLPSDAPTAGA